MKVQRLRVTISLGLVWITMPGRMINWCLSSGLPGGGRGEVPQSDGFQRSASQREDHFDVPGGHSEGGAERHGGAAVGGPATLRALWQGHMIRLLLSVVWLLLWLFGSELPVGHLQELERERQAHRVLQVQFTEMKETLRRTEELLTVRKH